MRRRLTLSVLTSVLVSVSALVVTSSPAEAHNVVHYMSQHPLPRKMGGGFCYIDVAHVHDFGPSDARMYRQIDGQYYFVGDPTPFEYQGPRYAYYGAHPVLESHVTLGEPVYCYLRGPHYHWYQPPPRATFELRGGAYWYTGAYEPVYYEQRPRFVMVNEAYAPIVYERPVVDVAVVPVGFQGELVGGGPGWRMRATVGAPVAAPPPPPPPVQVQVGVGLNFGGPPAPVYVEQRDHGNHRGWREKGDRGGGWHGAPPAPRDNGWHGAPPAPRDKGWHGVPATQQRGGWHGAPPPPRDAGWHRPPEKKEHGGGWKR
jgi:hypothetical protein